MKLGDSSEQVKQWQALLNKHGYSLAVDGHFGIGTDAATRKFQIANGLKPDGIVGQKTTRAAENKIASNLRGWPKQNYEKMIEFYGPVGENQISLELPYQLKLAWDLSTKVSRITCHKKVAASLYKIFESTLSAYGFTTIEQLGLDLFGGCLNVRKMRGGTSWSVHSWGAAVDIDPYNNQLKWSDEKASLAKKEYEAFWDIVEQEGWVSLGRRKNYDWMHFQAAQIV
jgi:hypothetical protein